MSVILLLIKFCERIEFPSKLCDRSQFPSQILWHNPFSVTNHKFVTETGFRHKFFYGNRIPSQIVTESSFRDKSCDRIKFPSQIIKFVTKSDFRQKICDENRILSLFCNGLNSVTICDGIRFSSQNLWQKSISVTN